MLAPWLRHVCPPIAFETFCNGKSELSQSNAFCNTFWWFGPRHSAPQRAKIAPRWLRDRLGSLFSPLDFSLRFLIFFGSVLAPFWVPKWSPTGATKAHLGGLGRLQVGAVLVLGRFFVRLVVWDRFFRSLRPLLGPFLIVPGAICLFLRDLFRFVGVVWGRFLSMFAFHSSILVCAFFRFAICRCCTWARPCGLRTARLE